VEAVRRDLDLLPTLLEVEGCFSWAQGAVTQAGWWDWLAGLPSEIGDVLPDGTIILGVHAAPWRDEGPGFRPEMSEAEAVAMVAGCPADLICVGHTHRVVDMQVKDKHVVNPGSVSIPPVPGADPRAGYAVIEADAHGYEVTHRRVAYDVERFIAQLKALRHPSAAYLDRYFRGNMPTRGGSS
jgi:hypothetical protein